MQRKLSDTPHHKIKVSDSVRESTTDVIPKINIRTVDQSLRDAVFCSK